MRDIARIEKGYEEPTRNELFFDSERAQGILIAASQWFGHRESGRCRRKEAGATERKPPARRRGVPQGILSARTCGASLGTFVINLIESVIIVVVILMLAMGFKSGIIIGISLIVTVFGSFLFLYTADGTMQRVSLAAFVLAMGMLVDNAIVIVDGILVDLKAGKNRMEAMTAIGRQTAMPLAASTDSHHRFPSHLPVAGHCRGIYPRPVHRTGGVLTTELGAGAGARATDGKPQAAPCR